MWRFASSTGLVSLCGLVATACSGDTPPTVALCGRGDRDVIAAEIASIELRFFDVSGAPLGDPVDLAPGDAHIDTEIPDGAASARAVGFDGEGAAVASGEGGVDAGGGCVCVALDAQTRAACDGVACNLVGDTCHFVDEAGDPITSQTLRFGEGPDDDVSGVTDDTFVQEDEPTMPHDDALIEAGPNPTRIALLRFDLAVLPQSAHIESVRLGLHVCDAADCGSSHSFVVLAVREAWSEAATFDERVPGTAWAATGCGAASCDPDPLGTLVVPDQAGEVELIDLMSDAVTGWVVEPAGNFGLALAPTSASGTAVHVDASEADGAGTQPPYLEVTYTLD